MLGHALPPDDHSIVVPTSALPFRTSVTFRREGRYSIGQSASVPRSFGQRFPSALFHRAVLTSKTTPAPYRAALQQPGCATVSPGGPAWISACCSTNDWTTSLNWGPTAPSDVFASTSKGLIELYGSDQWEAETETTDSGRYR